jgi:hypothetical protein
MRQALRRLDYEFDDSWLDRLALPEHSDFVSYHL